MTLPCRDAFLSIAPQIRKWWIGPDELKCIVPEEDPEEDTLIDSQLGHTYHSYSSISSTNPDVEQNSEGEVSIPVHDSNILDKFIHVSATFVIASSAYFAAVAVPGKCVNQCMSTITNALCKLSHGKASR